MAKEVTLKLESYDGGLRVLTALTALQGLRTIMQEYCDNEQSLLTSEHILAQIEVIEFVLGNALETLCE